MSWAINHSFKRPAFPAPADGQGSIPTADARGAGRGLVGPHTNPQSAGAVTNHSSDADVIRATTLPAGSGSEEIPASNSHPQSTSSPIAAAGEDAAPPVSSPAPSSTAGERSVRFAILVPSPLPCRAAGGEVFEKMTGRINNVGLFQCRLPHASEVSV